MIGILHQHNLTLEYAFYTLSHFYAKINKNPAADPGEACCATRLRRVAVEGIIA
jgi:hypothetical protein